MLVSALQDGVGSEQSVSSQHSTWEMSHPAASHVLVSTLQDGVGSEQSVSSQHSTWELSHPAASHILVSTLQDGVGSEQSVSSQHSTWELSQVVVSASQTEPPLQFNPAQHVSPLLQSSPSATQLVSRSCSC